VHSVFFLDKRYSCISVTGSCGQTRNRLHIYRRPCCTLVGANPYTNRSATPHSVPVVVANRTPQRVSRAWLPPVLPVDCIFGFTSGKERSTNSCRASARLRCSHGHARLHADMVRIKRLSPHKHRRRDARVLVDQGDHGLLPARFFPQLMRPFGDRVTPRRGRHHAGIQA
jgi:hypothetical protein